MDDVKRAIFVALIMTVPADTVIEKSALYMCGKRAQLF